MTAAREGNSLERVSVGMAATIRSALGLVKKKNVTDRCRSPETERTGCKKDKKMGQRVEWMATGQAITSFHLEG